MKLLRQYIREICGDSSVDIDDALATANLAHLGQMRRSGGAYIEHPKEVANLVYAYYGETTLCAAALLHDALEDAPAQGNVNVPEEMASMIAGSFGDPDLGNEILSLVQALTHQKSQPYTEYVLSLASNPGALKIKLADMLHNISSTPSARQLLKYRTALEALQSEHGDPPTGISPAHWKDITAAAGLVTEERILREYIRTLLKEAINPKIMSMIDRAEERGLKVYVNNKGDWGTVIMAPRLKNPNSKSIALVGWSKPPSYSGNCSDAMEVNHSQASDGFGPLVYDVAIEATGGLMSDRSEVSHEAESVWYHYMKKRSDVKADQLDITKDFGVPQLTPDYELDDCGQVPAFDLYGSEWHGTGLSQKISKVGTPVMDELRKRGMLQE